MKPLVIYHANCADGFGAAFAAWLKLGDEAEYLPMHYGDDSFEKTGAWLDREVYILDFSFKRDLTEHIFANARRVVWLDHHKSAFEMYVDELERVGEQFTLLREGHYTILDNTKSGAYLAWEYFHPDTEVPMLIRHIDDYDRWQFKIDGTKAFNKALWSHAPWNFEQWRRFLAFNPVGEPEMLLPECFTAYSNFLRGGEAILRAHEQNVASVVTAGVRKCELVWRDDTSYPINTYMDHNKVDGLACNCPAHLVSDVGHALATQSGTFGLCWFQDAEGKVRCSLRSNGDYDVSLIAKVFGGGGHRNAAGFETDMATLQSWLK